MADWAPLLDAARAEAARFVRACTDPRAVQLALLGEIVRTNRETAFGIAHGFAAVDGVAAFRQRVPVASYEDHAPAIARIAGGADGELVSDPVIAFEETGGSSAGGKLIPYTAPALDSFRRAVLPWLGDLARRRPGIAAGRAYVSISPATRARRFTPSGLPIGLDSDAAYLGAGLAPALAAVLAVPPQVGTIRDPQAWQIATLTALVMADDLSFVSLWSPTFLIALLAALEPLGEAVMAGLDPAGRQRLARALAGPLPDTGRLWPRLDCISCWGDGPSVVYARQLATLFPHAAIEPKGLLATEAAITLPWGEGEGCVPALASAFLEFVDAQGEPHLCDALEPGRQYGVIVTTPGGLYRYAMGDVVECLSAAHSLPRLRFVGRAGLASDLVGEKLSEAFVAGVLAGLDWPAVLVGRSQPPGYVLHIEAGDLPAGLAAEVEARLCANPQYGHARRMGQLAPLQVAANRHLSAQLAAAGLAGGRRMGDLKPVALLTGAIGDGLKA